jgi:D-alanyl-D-alanine carboxypeptidase (penicillin-binding protein 5/6)
MFIDPATPVSVNDLLHGLMVQSGNDAAVALAEAVAGDEATFVTLMNREAQRMGMKNTKLRQSARPAEPGQLFDRARPLHAGQARDPGLPAVYKIDSVKEFTYNKITQPNRNRLLWLDPTVDGMKTGHTESRLLHDRIGQPPERQPGERRLISVVMGATSDGPARPKARSC